MFMTSLAKVDNEIQRGYRNVITVDQMAEELSKLNIPMVAGKGGLDREICYVTTLELNERTSRIQEKGLLLSTFHAFKDEKEIVEHLRWLLSIGVSAIGFHTSVYTAIPEPVMRFAEKHHLPVFLLPADTPYNLVFELFNRIRQEIRDSERERVGRLNQLLIESILSGKSLRMIIEMIGEYSGGNFVSWMDSELTILEQWTGQHIERSSVLTIIKTLKNEKERLQAARVMNEPCYLKGDDSNNFLIVFPIFSDIGFGGYLSFHYTPEQRQPDSALMEDLIRTASKILTSDIYHLQKQKGKKTLSILEQLIFGSPNPQLISELQIVKEIEYHLVLVEPEIPNNNGQLERLSRRIELHVCVVQNRS